MLSAAARLKFNRCIAEMRRGRVSSSDMAADLLARLEACGISVTEQEPDLEAMASALVDAGYAVTPPVKEESV
jgi:hypothetical protein